LVYTYPANEVRFSFSSIRLVYGKKLNIFCLDICQLEVQDLVISRDAKKMIAVAGVPDSQIRYFDIETGLK